MNKIKEIRPGVIESAKERSALKFSNDIMRGFYEDHMKVIEQEKIINALEETIVELRERLRGA